MAEEEENPTPGWSEADHKGGCVTEPPKKGEAPFPWNPYEEDDGPVATSYQQ